MKIHGLCGAVAYYRHVTEYDDFFASYNPARPVSIYVNVSPARAT
ncbi:3-hydroxymyristoyl/3-hydroxydecanoyl-(acyl carrier protein) dehydratase [Glaciimonas immobilis]|uniref:3-hydroxymyristoyl/3-hydroxydecanoyl-(Acyl carrier protein) dehydratase n=1 Tax=Glaciimonas immobilis TaxID=728004 RepID=A0A840RPC8_9BURK|nr:3-hydroxymyristoyl/3-hydroxydecanoyl-(acyl carrier protein) dehydratase [Glaciimonas immobilis]